MTDAPFFVGYDARVPRRLAIFAIGCGACLVAGFVLFALSLGAATGDPGSGQFTNEVTRIGILQASPYPILIEAPDAAHPQGHATLLAGDGKIGVEATAARLGGKAVMAHGVLVKRGDLDMMVTGGDDAFKAAAASTAQPLPAAQPLGRWRITGEICDGKCYAGAMHPGTGLAHKACASLCLDGGVPPVLVSTAPVDGSIFLLLADASGGPAPPAMNDLIGLPITLDGVVERLGDMLVFRADFSSARAP